MSTQFEQCPTCGTQNAVYRCNGCGKNITHDEEAVNVGVKSVLTPSQTTTLDYCRPCAVAHLPLAVGVAPGSDLPAEEHPRPRPPAEKP